MLLEKRESFIKKEPHWRRIVKKQNKCRKDLEQNNGWKGNKIYFEEMKEIAETVGYAQQKSIAVVQEEIQQKLITVTKNDMTR